VTVAGSVPVAAVPFVYAAAMAVEAVAALFVGWVYDRTGAAILLVVPVLVALVPALALGPTLTTVVVGVVVWGFAHGVQDSTIKAAVADLVEAPRRATAYGVFAGIQGLLDLLGPSLGGLARTSEPEATPLLAAGLPPGEAQRLQDLLGHFPLRLPTLPPKEPSEPRRATGAPIGLPFRPTRCPPLCHS